MKKYLPYIFVLAAVSGAMAWYYGFREVTFDYKDESEHYKYGSIGLEASNGVPYEIWKVMPEVCSDQLPGKNGWLSFGLLWEDGKEMPIGLSRKIIGVERVGLNCAVCHTGSYRPEASAARTIVQGAPPSSFDIQAYTRFLFNCSKSDNFNAEKISAAIAKRGDVSLLDRLIHRFFVIPLTRRELIKMADQFKWFDSRPDQGPGRVEVYAPVKFRIFHMDEDGIVGTVDHPSVWNQQLRAGHSQHWDGNNNTYRERNIAVAISIAGGAEVDINSINRVSDYLWTLPSPKFPFPINTALAKKGEAIYESQCAECHAPKGAQSGKVVPIEYIGTDRGRLDSFSEALVERIKALTPKDTAYVDYYRPFHKTNGYVNGILDGIWLRGPYLHNGSVPSLWDLLQAPELRPEVFYRGSDILDPEKVGFASAGQGVEKTGFRYDTRVKGNGNGGHLHGTKLSEADKRALLEYLKTL